MVYVFDPTTCDEPKKPTYKYKPIPKAEKCSCCPEVKKEEETKPAEVAPPANNVNPPAPTNDAGVAVTEIPE